MPFLTKKSLHITLLIITELMNAVFFEATLLDKCQLSMITLMVYDFEKMKCQINLTKAIIWHVVNRHIINPVEYSYLTGM